MWLKSKAWFCLTAWRLVRVDSLAQNLRHLSHKNMQVQNEVLWAECYEVSSAALVTPLLLLRGGGCTLAMLQYCNMLRSSSYCRALHLHNTVIHPGFFHPHSKFMVLLAYILFGRRYNEWYSCWETGKRVTNSWSDSNRDKLKYLISHSASGWSIVE